ncbi:MAG: DUF935 family protein [Bacteroidetes bacterium]|nr:DUF935 family protein [Bacteroidota bacterium]
MSNQDNSKYQLTRYDVEVRAVNRDTKDIADWRDAHRTAERVLMPNRVRLYDLYADVLLDGHLSGVISKRFDAVLNKALYFENEKERVKEMDKLCRSLKFRDLITLILETKLWGVTGIEFIPGAELQFLKMRRKHIKPNIGIYTKEQYGYEGYDYKKQQNLWVIGDPEDLGLLLKCSPYALYKRGGMADWAQYCEIFGLPVRVVKYDAHDTQTKVELKKVLDESGTALALMIPNQANFEMHDGKQSNGNGELQETFKNALNNEMSIIILGNTETTSNDNGGSNAKSKVHRNEQLEITKSDIKYVTNIINDPQFLAILKSYGYPVDGGEFVFKKDVDLTEINTQMGLAQQAKLMGVPIGDDYIYELTGIPKPANYEAQKKTAAAQVADDNADDEKKPPVTKKKRQSGEPEDWTDTELSSWNKLRAKLADFFDPPR